MNNISYKKKTTTSFYLMFFHPLLDSSSDGLQRLFFLLFLVTQTSVKQVVVAQRTPTVIQSPSRRRVLWKCYNVVFKYTIKSTYWIHNLYKNVLDVTPYAKSYKKKNIALLTSFVSENRSFFFFSFSTALLRFSFFSRCL